MQASLQPKSKVQAKANPLQMKGPGCDCPENAPAGTGQCRACGGPVQRKASPSFDLDSVSLEHGSARQSGSASKLPSPLKQRMEARSGLDLDDVQVFRNSPEPEKVGAWAFTKGTQIHLGPGQDKHLAHESWHAVQQKQGRVKANDALFGIPVNDQSSLETEADRVAAEPANTAVTAALPESPAPASDGGVLQGVFKDAEGNILDDEELEEAVEDYDLSKAQEADLMTKQGWARELWLRNWLERNGLVQSRKRKRRPPVPEDEVSSSEDESRKPPPRKRRDRKKSPAVGRKAKSRRKVKAKPGTRSKAFGNNLGFQVTPPESISKRLYYPEPALDLTPSLPVSARRKSNARVSFAPTMRGLQQDAFKPGFRGNIVEAKFELFYRQNGTTTFNRAPLPLPGVPKEFSSADSLSRTATTDAYNRINEMQRVIGMKTGQPIGTTVHSERNMILQLDDLQIDDKLVTEIQKFARGKNITIIRAVLLVFSEPNEVCGNCDTALRALTGATKIKAMAARLTRAGVKVDPSFGLQVQTGARQLKTVRKYQDPFSGKPSQIPSIMHTFPKAKL